jgi:hypothetical protein
MVQPNVKVLGVYKVEVSNELFNSVMESKYGGIQLPVKQGKEAEKAVRDELSSIYLLEILIDNPDEKFKMGDIKQSGSDQVAYDEAYLSTDGQAIISHAKRPLGNSIRVAFFLHFFDPQKPLLTSYGEISVPRVEEMPTRLKEIMPYRPVD